MTDQSMVRTVKQQILPRATKNRKLERAMITHVLMDTAHRIITKTTNQRTSASCDINAYCLWGICHHFKKNIYICVKEDIWSQFKTSLLIEMKNVMNFVLPIAIKQLKLKEEKISYKSFTVWMRCCPKIVFIIDIFVIC